MSRMVKEFIDIKECGSIEALIAKLIEVRDALPATAEAEVKMRGDDIFGRQLTVSYMRPQSVEEAACDARYADAYRESRERELTRLQDELGFCPLTHRGSPNLRIVA